MVTFVGLEMYGGKNLIDSVILNNSDCPLVSDCTW